MASEWEESLGSSDVSNPSRDSEETDGESQRAPRKGPPASERKKDLPLESRRHRGSDEELSRERALWPTDRGIEPGSPASSAEVARPRIPPAETPHPDLDHERSRADLFPLPTFPRNSSPYLFDDGTGVGPSMVDFEIQVEHHARRLRSLEIDRLIWIADNSSRWPILELAAYRAGVVFIPLPATAPFGLIDHVIRVTGADALLTVEPDRLTALLGEGEPLPPTWSSKGWRISRTPERLPAIPRATARITFTRGITGPPRGVCHSLDQIWDGTRALHEALQTSRHDTHLALLPLADLAVAQWTMLDPLLNGGHAILPPLAPLGLSPGHTPDASTIHSLIVECEPTTLLITPAILEAWIDSLPPYPRPQLDRLRRVVVTGAPLSHALRRRGKEMGLPLYEGYGLVECGSIVAMNTPLEQLEGSVGKPLRPYETRIGSDGELWVKGPGSLGMLDEEGFVAAGVECPTGDVGFNDPVGFLSIQGRKRFRIITEEGRRVCPEWIEETLREQSAIVEAFVFGNGERHLSAALVPQPGHEGEVERALDRVNSRLPQEARLRTWTILTAPLSREENTLTPSGYPDRDEIFSRVRGVLYEDTRA